MPVTILVNTDRGRELKQDRRVWYNKTSQDTVANDAKSTALLFPSPNEPMTMPILMRFVQDDRGQDITEYALLTSLISIVTVLVLKAIGSAVANLYVYIRDKIQ